MKAKNTAFSSVTVSSAAIFTAVGIMILVLVAVFAFYSDNKSSLAVHDEQQICQNTPFELPFSAVFHKSIVKRVNTPVFRRPGALPAMPFSLTVRFATGCCTVHTVPPTPALYPAANPATFVRAGPFDIQKIIKRFS